MSRRQRVETCELRWRHPVSGVIVRIQVKHSPDYLESGSDMIEVTASPKRTALPITSTGYVAHFLTASELAAAGGAKSFVQQWMAREEAGKAWQAKVAAERQGDLFKWADAHEETMTRGMPKRCASRPDTSPKARQRPAKRPA
jgi:hypothetical protein